MEVQEETLTYLIQDIMEWLDIFGVWNICGPYDCWMMVLKWSWIVVIDIEMKLDMIMIDEKIKWNYI